MSEGSDSGLLGRFTGRDGQPLAYRSIGAGRPLVLLHGFTSSGAHFLQSGPEVLRFLGASSAAPATS